MEWFKDKIETYDVFTFNDKLQKPNQDGVQLIVFEDELEEVQLPLNNEELNVSSDDN